MDRQVWSPKSAEVIKEGKIQAYKDAIVIYLKEKDINLDEEEVKAKLKDIQDIPTLLDLVQASVLSKTTHEFLKHI